MSLFLARSSHQAANEATLQTEELARWASPTIQLTQRAHSSVRNHR